MAPARKADMRRGSYTRIYRSMMHYTTKKKYMREREERGRKKSIVSVGAARMTINLHRITIRILIKKTRPLVRENDILRSRIPCPDKNPGNSRQEVQPTSAVSNSHRLKRIVQRVVCREINTRRKGGGGRHGRRRDYENDDGCRHHRRGCESLGAPAVETPAPFR